MCDMAVFVGPILKVIGDENMYWRKKSVFPSQKRIQKELWEKFGINISIRTVNRWLAKAESAGLLRRKKRHKKDPLFGWTFQSSLNTITGLGWKLLIKAKYYTWDEFRSLIKEAEANFRKPKNPRKVFRSSGELTSVGDIFDGLVFDST